MPSFKRCYHGALWGLVVFLIHFIWLYELLVSKSNATFLQATLIYFFVIFYAFILSSLWFLIFRWFGFIISTIFFYFFLQNYSLWFLGRVEGYPFLNPFIPLAKYKWFLYLYSLIFCFSLPQQYNFKKNDFKFFYLKPTFNSFDKKGKKISASILGQNIYHELCKLDLEKYSSECKNLIIVSPETFYPFCLNKNLEHVKLWGCALPDNAHFLLGSQRIVLECDSTKIFQTVYWLNKGRIKNFYDKKHCVPFTEKLPSRWKYFKWACNMFLKEKGEFDSGCDKEGVDFFEISDDMVIIPQICSDIFFTKIVFEKNYKFKNKILCFFVNDSWFLGYFKKIMENLGQIKSIEYGIPLIYISHEKCIL
ncbi:hypothetical protein KAT08_02390 [Candidatus Babeliales bacterium]|nr:hypothetical protein [Candidatus Babeliales bacterium]